MSEPAQKIPTDEEIQAHWQGRYTYWGYLADDNVEHVAQRIKNLLDGRGYTFVAQNASHASHSAPEVRTSQRLKPKKNIYKEAPSVYRIGEPLSWKPDEISETCGLSCSDTYGVWGIHSSFATEREARKAADDGSTVTQTTYFVIEGGRAPDDIGRNSRIEIRQYNGYGEILHWTIAPEHERRLRDDYWEVEQLPPGSLLSLGHPANGRRAVLTDQGWVHTHDLSPVEEFGGTWDVLYVPEKKED